MDTDNKAQLSLDFQGISSTPTDAANRPQAVVLSVVRTAAPEQRLDAKRKDIALNEILSHARKLSW